MGQRKKAAMDWMKNAVNSAGEMFVKGCEAANKAGNEKQLEMKIWNAQRQIKNLKGEWGVAAYDAFIAQDDTLNAITESFTAQIEEHKTRVAEWTATLQKDYGHAPPPDPEADAPANSTQQ